MLPLGDENEPGLGIAWVTLSLIAVNVAVFLLLQQAGADNAFTYGYSTVPAEITSGHDLVNATRVVIGGTAYTIQQAPGPVPIYLTLLTSMFMHGGWLHLGGNMLFLFIFGDNVEHFFGSLRYLAFYLVAGLVAGLAQVAASPDSSVPSLGASGAISGVLGAYLVLFPRNRVTVLLVRFLVQVPAIFVIGIWILLQFVDGLGSVAVTEQTGGVAYFAHIGGFIAGVAGAFALRAAGGVGRPHRPSPG